MGKIVGTPILGRDRKRPKKGNYYIYWTDNELGSREKSLKTKVTLEAQKLFDYWMRENRGGSVTRRLEDVTIDEVLDHYVTVQGLKVSAPERIEYAKKALLSYWSGKPASAVNRYSCAKYGDFRRDAYKHRWPKRDLLSPNTIRRDFAVLAAALVIAYDDKLIDQPVTVFRPVEERSDVQHFSCDEAVALIRMAWRLGRARHHLRLFLLIGFLTGRRKEAILSLKWKDVYFTTNIIIWNPEGRRETKKARPPGAMPKRLRKHLLRHRRHFPEDEYVISYRGHGIDDIKTAFSTLVRLYQKEYRQKLVVNGLTEDEAMLQKILPQAHPHMMRHSCATWLMQKGVRVSDACSFLGMSEETLRLRYWHHHPDYQRGPADAL